MMPVIETRSGARVDLLCPRPASITIDDIAWSLSRTARFNGHTDGCSPYSVAQHSVWVAQVVQDLFDADPVTTLQALLHDAHEAYTGDIASPLKHLPALRPHIKAIERGLQEAIHVAFDVPPPDAAQDFLIHYADRLALAVEADRLMRSGAAGYGLSTDLVERASFPLSRAFDLFRAPLSHHCAHVDFLLAYLDLSGGRRLQVSCA